MNHTNYSIPIAAGGRDFAFSIPDDLTEAEAGYLSEILPRIVGACAVPAGAVATTSQQVSVEAPDAVLPVVRNGGGAERAKSKA